MSNIHKAYFAAGCFWGVEHLLQKQPGVIKTTVGYMGGDTDEPSYQDVSYKSTGHAEVVEVVFDAEIVSFEELAKLFFEIHDPSQLDRQGPDKGDQYRSEIFYTSPQQQEISHKLIAILKEKGYEVVTKVTPAPEFWPAEDYHQQYYVKNGNEPYCHVFREKF